MSSKRGAEQHEAKVAQMARVACKRGGCERNVSNHCFTPHKCRGAKRGWRGVRGGPHSPYASAQMEMSDITKELKGERERGEGEKERHIQPKKTDESE